MARVRAFLEVAEVIEAEGQRIGVLKVAEEPGSLRIVQLQLLPEHQHQGIGSSIIRGVLQRARIQGKMVTLSVLLANPAKRLYERLGFRVVGQDEQSFHMEREA